MVETMSLFSKIKGAINYINQPIQPTFFHLMIGGVVIGVTAIATYQLPSLISSYFKTPEPEPEPIYVFVEKTGNYLWSLGAGTVLGIYSAYNRRWYNDTLNKITNMVSTAHQNIANTRLGSMLPAWAMPKRQQNPEHTAILKPLSEQLMKFNPEDPTKVNFAINMDEINLDELCQAPFAVGIDGKSRKMFEIRLVKEPVNTSQHLQSDDVDSKKVIAKFH